MVRTLDIEWIVPQHGRPYRGQSITHFLDWVENLQCGLDLINQHTYRIPPPTA
jgi:flavorubredoxin